MIRLYNQDCLRALRNIESNSVDLIITDPPYNIGNFMKKRKTNLNRMRDNFFVGAEWDNLEYDEWINQMESFFSEIARVSKEGMALILFMSIIRVESILKIAEKNKFYYKTTGIWHKFNPMPRNMNLHFVNSTEAWIYFVYKKKTSKFNNNGKVIHDFIETSLVSTKEKKWGKHPTQKPEKLIEFFVTILSDENDTVLDPFMGSGTTGIVSVKNNRNFIGIEINEEYYKISQKRIMEEENASY